MAERLYINPKALPDPPGNFSWVTRSGNTLYLAGQVGIDASGKTIGIGDAEAQVMQAYRNIEATLKELGGSLNNLVKVVTFVVGKENMAAARKGRKAVGDSGMMTIKPASTLVVVAALADDSWLVEVDAIAILD
ncbi:MAG: RidA family protein [Betaproteobacteria bacterium]|nr:RidA family protein [Betaproteobacteria bacterium]